MENFIFLAETETNAAVILLNLFFVFLLELVIAFVYRRTHRTLSYSQSFIGTIILMGCIASLIMMVVTENIVGAFALLGAFSLIRFRTIVKETRDIAFVFFSLAIGVAVGTNNYTVALIGTLFISGIILALHKINFASQARGGYILLIPAGSEFDPENKGAWHSFLRRYNTLHIKSAGNGTKEYTLAVQLENQSNATQMINALEKTSGVRSVELMSGKDAIEY